MARRARLSTLLKVEEGGVLGVAFAADRKTLVAGFNRGGRGGVVLWDVARREHLGTPLQVQEGGVLGVAFAGDGTKLAAGFFKDETGGVVLWDAAGREPLGTPLKVEEGSVRCVAFAADGKTLAAGFFKGGSGGVVLWDVPRSKRLGPPLQVEEGGVLDVAFAADGKTLAAGFYKERLDKTSTGGVVLWDVAQRNRLGAPLKVEEGGVRCVAFDADGKTLAAGFYNFYKASFDTGGSGGVVLWDVLRRERLGTPLQVEEGGVLDVTFAADGKRLAAGFYKEGLDKIPTGGVVLWDVAQRMRLGTPLNVEEGGVLGVGIAADDRTLAAGFSKGETGGVVLWDAKRRERLGTPLKAAAGGVRSVAFAPDGRILASGLKGARGGGVMIWDVAPDSWARQACRIANRNLSWEEWQTYVGPDVEYHRTCPDLPDGEGVAEALQAKAAGR